MANVNIRVDDTLKHEAEIIFSELGLSMSSATNAFYKQVVRCGGIPFELRIETSKQSRQPLPGNGQERSRMTLEQVFSEWNGEAPEAYDWGEMSDPVGRELI